MKLLLLKQSIYSKIINFVIKGMIDHFQKDDVQAQFADANIFLLKWAANSSSAAQPNDLMAMHRILHSGQGKVTKVPVLFKKIESKRQGNI